MSDVLFYVADSLLHKWDNFVEWVLYHALGKRL